METSGIYMIKNKINGKIYIGQSADIKKRWSSHIRKLENNTHENYDLQNDFNKYKIESFQFEVLKQLIGVDRKQLLIEESRYMSALNSIGHGYNKVLSTTNGSSVEIHDPSTDEMKHNYVSLKEGTDSDAVYGLKVFYFIKRIEQYGYKTGNYNNIFSVFRDAGIFKYIQVGTRKYNIAEKSYVEQGYFNNIILQTIRQGKNVNEYKIHITPKGEKCMIEKMKQLNLFVQQPTV